MTFRETAETLEELPRLMLSAERKMGLPKHAPGKATFTEDCLRIEVHGPDQPRLTLIDVPGLVQTGEQSIRETITGMTEKYINNPRSIILAVLGAHDVTGDGAGASETEPSCKWRTAVRFHAAR